jgi:SAM-dependent methyltransferase
MQAYGESFASAYNRRWAHFSAHFAPQILELLRAELPDSEGHGEGDARRVLDLCCGTGQLLVALAEAGYRSYGIDLSEAMLAWAAENTERYRQSGRVTLSRQDAERFTLPERVHGVVSLFDSVNHLTDREALERCFRSVADALLPGGLIAFDINTRYGLRRWSNLHVEEEAEMTVITRGIYDEERRRAYLEISGFARRADGLYERFHQTAYNTAFTVEEVRTSLERSGFRDVRVRHFPTFAQDAEEPESLSRVLFTAHRS